MLCSIGSLYADEVKVGRQVEFSSTPTEYTILSVDNVGVEQADGNTSGCGSKKGMFYKDKTTVTLNCLCYRSSDGGKPATQYTSYNDGVYAGVKITVAKGFKLKVNKVFCKVAVSTNNFSYRVVLTDGTKELYKTGDKTVGKYNTTSATNTEVTANPTDVYVTGTVYLRMHYWLNPGNASKYIAPLELSLTGELEQDIAQLATPEMSFNDETGVMTITQADGKDIYYTTDGTEPTVENGTKYTKPFPVADATTVKAKSFGDGETNVDSKVASIYALYKTVTIAEPVIVEQNGTVSVSCATPNTKIEYSTNGADYKTYTIPFTLLDDASVAIRVTRENCTNAEKTIDVKAIKSKYPTKRVWLDYSTFDTEDTETTKTENVASADKHALLKGNTAETEGYNLELNAFNKNYQWVNYITLNGKDFRGIKTTNAGHNILHLPAGVKVARMILYSVVNGVDQGNATGWSYVNGDQDYKTIPMGAYKTGSAISKTPDVRVFDLGNAEGDIDFFSSGSQLGFAIALDVIDETANISGTLSPAGMGTFCAPSAYKAPEGLGVYTAAEADNVVTLTKVEDGVIPAGQGVVLSGEAGATYTMEPATTDKTELDGNALKAAVSATTINNENTYVLICNGENKGQFALLEKGETIPAGKAYLELGSNEAGANYLSLAFGNETAIKAIDAAKKTVGDNAYYNLQGKKIERPQHGAYIHNGKVYVIK